MGYNDLYLSVLTPEVSQYSLAATGLQSSPIYVVYKIGGDPGEGQFLSELPKEIPYGYTCVYIPDNINPTRTGQLVGTAASGADAEKQAWLAKYATGPSAEPSAPGVLSVDQISAILRISSALCPRERRSAIPSRTQANTT